MEVFEGTVRLAGETGSLRAVLLVADDRLKVSAQEHEIGDWPLNEISANLAPDGCHVAVEGEELIVSVPEPIRFAEAIGPRWTNPGDGSLLHPERRQLPGDEPGSLGRRVASAIGRVPHSWKAAASGAALAVTLGLLAPGALIALVLFAALAGLLVGGFALMDPFTAVRLPRPITPLLLVRAGIAGVALAIALAIVA